MKVAIAAVAKGIDKDVIERFMACTKGTVSNHSIDTVLLGDDDTSKEFFKTRILNRFLRRAVHKYDVIIQTDIDLVFPSDLVNFTISACIDNPEHMHHSVLRYINATALKGRTYKQYPWKQWVKQTAVMCSGCWNGACSDTWKKSGGWNEDMYGWGSEDTEFWNRTREKGIQWKVYTRFPLMHINHPQRTVKRAKENMAMAAKYDINSNWITGNVICK
jgi:hypothetical protein